MNIQIFIVLAQMGPGKISIRRYWNTFAIIKKTAKAFVKLEEKLLFC